MNLSKNVALVTGGAAGIGKGCVEELLANGIKGVTIADINEKVGEATTKELKQRFGNQKVIFIKTDVTNKRSFEAAFQATVEAYGNIDILINNAGIMNEVKWEACIGVNLMGTINGTLLAIERYFPKHKCGDKAYIINLSSIAGISPSDFCPVYAATKHGVIGLTRSYGENRHIRNEGICVIALCPAATDTPLVDYMRDVINYKDLFDEAYIAFNPLKQKTSAVGKAAIQAMKDNDSGSAWFIQEGLAYKINFPAIDSLIKMPQ